jgi:hypothetical protein
MPAFNKNKKDKASKNRQKVIFDFKISKEDEELKK